ncbi:MAG: hypothetical protein LBK70_03585 [Clostridiales bacterium]|jgi:hypothetical protein|nr:hypothetical protein [Clostridiales bacterium]
MKKLFLSKNIIAMLLIAILSIGLLVACIRTKETEIVHPDGVKVTNLNDASKVAYGSTATLQVEFVFEEHDHDHEDVEIRQEFDANTTIEWSSNLVIEGIDGESDTDGIIFENLDYNKNTHKYTADAYIVMNHEMLDNLDNPEFVLSEDAMSATVSVVVKSFDQELTADLKIDLAWAPVAYMFVSTYRELVDVVASNIDPNDVDPTDDNDPNGVLLATILQAYSVLMQVEEDGPILEFNQEFVVLSTHIKSLVDSLFTPEFVDFALNNSVLSEPNLEDIQSLLELQLPYFQLLEEVYAAHYTGGLDADAIAAFDERVQQLLATQQDTIDAMVDIVTNIMQPIVVDIDRILLNDNLTMFEQVVLEGNKMLIENILQEYPTMIQQALQYFIDTIQSILHPDLYPPIPPVDSMQVATA